MNQMIRSLSVGVLMVFGCLYSQPAGAETVCSKDYLGRTVCRTSNGGTFTGTRDYLGRDVWRGSDGSQTTCKTDYLGRYVCY